MSSNDAIVSKNLDSTVTSWILPAGLFGYTAEEMIGRPISILAAPDRENEMPVILESIRRGKRSITMKRSDAARKVKMQDTTTAAEGGSVATYETKRLIASDKVEGTDVYNRAGERLGEVYNFMVDKYSGRVAYAVMSFGGFLGIGEKYHPLPWKVLTYDTGLSGYVVDLDEETLRGAPSFDRDEVPDWGSRDWGTRVHDYYRVPLYEGGL
jgi:PAS domain S-box-containing protein